MSEKRLFVAILMLYLATTLQGKTATFKVQVKNEGRVFNEVVKINTQRKTETFDVPSQQGFEAAQFIHDFRKKLTMISLPEKQVCYLSRLSDNLPNPSKLIRAFKKAATGDKDPNLERVKTTMGVKELFQDHTSLSDAMRKQCRGSLIYRIKPAEESISITTIFDGAVSGDDQDRFRRSHCSSSVCYPVRECYVVPCDSSGCLECKTVKICKPISC